MVAQPPLWKRCLWVIVATVLWGASKESKCDAFQNGARAVASSRCIRAQSSAVQGFHCAENRKPRNLVVMGVKSRAPPLQQATNSLPLGGLNVDTAVDVPKSIPQNMQSLFTLGVLFKRTISQISLIFVGLWGSLPAVIRQIINPRDLAVWACFQLVYQRALRGLHWALGRLRARLGRGGSKDYGDSVLGFLEPKLGYLARLLGGAYLSNGVLGLLADQRSFPVYKKVHSLVTNVIYIIYTAYLLNELKTYFLPVLLPQLTQDSRRNYILQKSSSFLMWAFAVIAVIDRISTFLGRPFSSTLAFGGISGIAFGLGSRDIVSNILGGLTLLVSEPFTPGDMVTFRYEGEWYLGKIERVGWYQTRLRMKDTRPTYIPNSVFMSTMVTNCDRITHRRFMHQVHLRHADLERLPALLKALRQNLRELPKVDLFLPFRIHFVEYGESFITVECYFYFATKNLDEYLFLQQTALLEIGRVIRDQGAMLAYPGRTLDLNYGARTTGITTDLATALRPATDKPDRDAASAVGGGGPGSGRIGDGGGMTHRDGGVAGEVAPFGGGASPAGGGGGGSGGGAKDFIESTPYGS